EGPDRHFEILLGGAHMPLARPSMRGLTGGHLAPGPRLRSIQQSGYLSDRQQRDFLQSASSSRCPEYFSATARDLSHSSSEAQPHTPQRSRLRIAYSKHSPHTQHLRQTAFTFLDWLPPREALLRLEDLAELRSSAAPKDGCHR